MKNYIERSMLERIYIQQQEFKGKKTIHCRMYCRTDDGIWVPTVKGVTFRANEKEAVLNLLKNEFAKMKRVAKTSNKSKKE